MPAPDFPLTALLKNASWALPLIKTVHLWGIVFMVGAVVMFDLRVLGLAKNISIRALARFLLPLSLAAVLIVVPSGALLLAGHPNELLANRIFTIKIGLIFLSACNALAFHTGPYASVAQWDTGKPAPLAAKLLTAISILLWLSVIFCGRMLAIT
ncbi:MAG: hypothetical protein ABI905_16910 [Betaproteobacteria bacterium]